MRIAVILPSRGTLFSKTLEELLLNLQGLPYKIYWCHNQPIPKCFNRPLNNALADDRNTHFWFVEDDMIFPPATLASLLNELETSNGAVACDYPVSLGGLGSVSYDPDGDALFTGTGCLLVTRDFLKAYKSPVFRSDIAWNIRGDGVNLELEPVKGTGQVYGFHDVNFGLLAYLRQTPIQISPIRCGQRKVAKMGPVGTNQGQHTIDEWRDIRQSPQLFELADTGRAGNTVNILLPDGTITLVTNRRAEALVNEAGAKVLGEQYLTVVGNALAKELGL